MPDARSSRELAERVERTFYERGNRFRFRVWATGVAAGAVALAWLALAAGRGDRTIYEARPVSTPHRIIENDCRKCHTDWAAGVRLITLDADVRSVSNEKCLACHDGPPHHAGQIPAHDQISCAACHHEHSGDMALTQVDDRHCIRCHGDLDHHGGGGGFAENIDRFAGQAGPGLHPEFAVHRLLQASADPNAQAAQGRDPVLEFFARQAGDQPLEAAPRWQDPGRIRFNHKVHLHARYEDGKLVEGLRGPDGQLLDWSKNCAACHVADDSGQSMRPIHYESHCAECHPLLFDQSRFPGETVPHDRPEILLGFLAQKYTLNVLHGDAQPMTENAPLRPFPGLPYRPRLEADQAQDVEDRVAAAEQVLLEHTHALLGREARGGCRYCHEVEDDPQQTTWRIVPPRIPERWLVHSRFRHDSHRMLDCTHCHRDFSDGTSGGAVGQSVQTGDVLMPTIAICRQCHSENPSPAPSTGLGRTVVGARTNCVECHVYHHPRQPSENPR